MRDFEIIRDTIKIPTVEWEMLEGNIAYLKIFTFNEIVDSEFENAAKEILKSGANSINIGT